MNLLSDRKADQSPQPQGHALKYRLTHLIVRAYALELILPRAPKPPLLVERIGVFPASGAIRCATQDGAKLLTSIKQHYAAQALSIEERNELQLVFADWRFSLQLCPFNGEAWLNVQSRGDISLMQRKTRELLRLITPQAD